MGILIGSYRFFFEFDHEIGYSQLGPWADKSLYSETFNNEYNSNFIQKQYKDRFYSSSWLLKNKPAVYFFLEKITWYDYSSAFRGSTGGSGAGSGGSGGSDGSGGSGGSGSGSIPSNTTLLELRVVRKNDGFYLEGLVSWSEVIETTGKAVFKITKIQGLNFTVLNELQLSPNEIGNFNFEVMSAPKELNYNFFNYKKIEEGLEIDYPKLGLGFIAQVKSQVNKLQTVESPGVQGAYYPKQNEEARLRYSFGYFENEDDVINYFESISELTKKEFKKLDDLNLLNIDLQTGLAPLNKSSEERIDLLRSYIKNTSIIEGDASINLYRYQNYGNDGSKNVEFDSAGLSWGKEISYKLFEIETEDSIYEYYLENLIGAEIVLANATADKMIAWAGSKTSLQKYMTLEGLQNFTVAIKVKDKISGSYKPFGFINSASSGVPGGGNETLSLPVRFDLLTDDSGQNPNWGTDVHLKGNYFTYNWLDESKLKVPTGFSLESATTIADFKTKTNGISEINVNGKHKDQVVSDSRNTFVRRPLRPFGANNNTKVIMPPFLRKEYVKNKIFGVVLTTDSELQREYGGLKINNYFLKSLQIGDGQRLKEIILGKKGKVTFRNKRPELQRFIDMFFRIEEPKAAVVIPLTTKKIISQSEDIILDGKVGMDLTEGSVFVKDINVYFDAFTDTNFYETPNASSLVNQNITDTSLITKLQKLKVAYINVDNVSKNDLLFLKGPSASSITSQASFDYINNPFLGTYHIEHNPFSFMVSYNSSGQGYLNSQYFYTTMRAVNPQNVSETSKSNLLLETFNDMIYNEYIKCYAVDKNTVMVVINSDAWDKWYANRAPVPSVQFKLTVVKVGEL